MEDLVEWRRMGFREIAYGRIVSWIDVFDFSVISTDLNNAAMIG